MELVKPSMEYKESFLEAVKEFKIEGTKIELYIPKFNGEVEEYIKIIEDHSKGKNLPEGYVPHTKLWLVDNGEFIGDTDIRHSLNDTLLKKGGHIGYRIRPSKRKMGYGTKILELALAYAKSLGIEKALLTCNDDNVGSAKIIEKQGGKLENIIDCDDTQLRRYWVENK